ncbi:TetR/AcrR family transcriptional regulator [Afifella sp. JA880]|uniref:TetR/AcrR family transcriptional regulator n=1 Tax=Afifella sp. JA880 TaxID=2975280 RepID=UPI0021BBA2CF|nr:TetR/AcrR family transcriptional regulator [Afifella sp. JA880]MCT8266245.1 TetR/AcrR family transcriptional regulator [Afifella sp. JA880]
MQIEGGRLKQKARTRRDLLEAARRLVDRGETVTVPTAADEAGISRATAYRYFSSADILTLESVLDLQVLPAEEVIAGASTVRERVMRVHRHLIDLTRTAEPQFRLFLARTLDASVNEGAAKARALRGGRRVAMLEVALEPARTRLGKASFRTLVNALSAVSGIEASVALKDACALNNEDADRATTAIVEALLARYGLDAETDDTSSGA